MKIPITFLGTAQAVPTAKRNHTSILIQYGAENILVDCGEGTQRQFRKAHINPCKLTRLFITHWHGDHILGLPGLFQTLALNGYNKTLFVYGPRGTKRFMEKLTEFFVPHGKIKMVINEVNSGKVFETKDFIVEAVPMIHGAPCNAYTITEKQKVHLDKKKLRKFRLPNSPLLGKLQQGKSIVYKGKTVRASQVSYKTKPKKIAIIMDTLINPNCYKAAKNADLLISEATFLENSENGKKLAKEYGHLTARQAGEIARKSKAKHLILAHLSQRYEMKGHLLLREAQKEFENTKIAEDLMKAEV